MASPIRSASLDDSSAAPIAPVEQPEDLDLSLRPRRSDEFVGQRKVKEQLTIVIEAAKKRNQPLDHVLFAGPPGLGKTSLAQIVAEELEVPFVMTAGPALRCRPDPRADGGTSAASSARSTCARSSARISPSSRSVRSLSVRAARPRSRSRRRWSTRPPRRRRSP